MNITRVGIYIKKTLTITFVGVFLLTALESPGACSGDESASTSSRNTCFAVLLRCKILRSFAAEYFISNTLGWAKEEELFLTGMGNNASSSSPAIKNSKLAQSSRFNSGEFKHSLIVAAICKHIEQDGNLNDNSRLKDVLARLDADENPNITVLPHEIVIEIPSEELAIRYFDPTKTNVITPYSNISKLSTKVIGPRLNRQIIYRIKALPLPIAPTSETLTGDIREIKPSPLPPNEESKRPFMLCGPPTPKKSSAGFKAPVAPDYYKELYSGRTRSYLERHLLQWTQMKDDGILTDLIDRAIARADKEGGRPHLKVLAFGVSTGEEIARIFYEIITELENRSDVDPQKWQIEIFGFDKDKKIVAEAKKRLEGKKPFVAGSVKNTNSLASDSYASKVVATLNRYRSKVQGSWFIEAADIREIGRIEKTNAYKNPDIVFANNILTEIKEDERVGFIGNLSSTWPDAVLAVGFLNTIDDYFMAAAENHDVIEATDKDNNENYYLCVPNKGNKGDSARLNLGLQPVAFSATGTTTPKPSPLPVIPSNTSQLLPGTLWVPVEVIWSSSQKDDAQFVQHIKSGLLKWGEDGRLYACIIRDPRSPSATTLHGRTVSSEVTAEDIRNGVRAIAAKGAGLEEPICGVPYGYNENMKIDTQLFRGGALREFTEPEMQNALAIRQAFAEGIKNNDPALTLAREKYGVDEAPTLKPLYLLKPLSIPVQTEDGLKYMAPMDAFHAAYITESEIDRLVQDQIIYIYEVPINKRLKEWDGEFDKRLEYLFGTQDKVEMLKKFAARLAVMSHLIHNYLNGVFDTGSYIGFQEKDVTVTGYTLDLDNIIIDGTKRENDQELIHRLAKNLITQFAKKLGVSAEAGIDAYFDVRFPYLIKYLPTSLKDFVYRWYDSRWHPSEPEDPLRERLYVEDYPLIVGWRVRDIVNLIGQSLRQGKKIDQIEEEAKKILNEAINLRAAKLGSAEFGVNDLRVLLNYIRPFIILVAHDCGLLDKIGNRSNVIAAMIESSSLPIGQYVNRNKQILKDTLVAQKQDVLLRIPIEVIESMDKENVKNFLGAFQNTPNGYLELYYMSGIGEVSKEIYKRFGLNKKSLPKGFIKTRENTITLFPALKGEEVAPGTILNRLGEVGLNPIDTILSPIGLQHDSAGLIRSTILGLRLLNISRQHKQSGDIDYEFVKETVNQLKEICESQGVPEFNLTNQDIIDIATGDDINKIMKALKKLIKLLPIEPIIEEDLKQIYLYAADILTAA